MNFSEYLTELSDIEFLTMCYHPKVIPTVISQYHELKSMFKGNELVISMIDYIKRAPRDEITRDSLKWYLKSIETSEPMIEKIVRGFDIVLERSDEEINQFIRVISNRIIQKKISELHYEYGGDALAYIQKIKEINTNSLTPSLEDTEFFRSVLFGKISQESIEKVGESVYESSFKIINESTPKQGYFPSQLVVFCAPPGGGKTLAFMNEAVRFVKQGLKVIYTAIGDINEFDFVSRISSIILGVPMKIVSLDPITYKEKAFKQCPEIMSNLLVHISEPDKLGISRYLEYIEEKQLSKDAQVLILDYDTNFLSESDSMYDKGEEIYNSAKGFADRHNLLVMVGSQPKQGYWDKDLIPLEALSESSRKQQIADMVLTFSHKSGITNHIGTMYLCKNRKGETRSLHYILDPSGNFYFISYKDYKYLITETHHVTMATSELDYGMKKYILEGEDGTIEIVGENNGASEGSIESFLNSIGK